MRALRDMVLVVALVLAAGSAGAVGATKVAMIGDAGVDNADQAAVASLAAGWAPDALVLLGDNYYSSVGLPSGTGRYDRTVGKYYCAFIFGAAPGPECAGGTSITNRLWPAPGNHDYSDAGIANYLAYFALPGNERYYDTRIGDIHVFVIDSDEAMRSASDMADQKAWLQAALRASDAPFRVVALHHPPYTSSSRGPYAAMRWPYAQWGADLVASGHDHFYERLEVDGIPYLVSGAGGNGLTAFPATGVPESRFGYGALHGALRLTSDGTAMTAEFVSVDGTSRDQVTVSAHGTGTTAPDRASPATPAGATPSGAAAPAEESCTRTFYQQGARTVTYDAARRAYRVVSRLRIMEDAQPWCRANLTVIYRNPRTKARAAQLQGSTLGRRTLRGRTFSAPVISWPTQEEMRFAAGDPTGQGRRNARMVLVSYLPKASSMPHPRDLELDIVRQLPAGASAAESPANPLRSQVASFGAAAGWATVR